MRHPEPGSNPSRSELPTTDDERIASSANHAPPNDAAKVDPPVVAPDLFPARETEETDTAWWVCREALRAEIPAQDFEAWVAPIQSYRRGSRLFLGAPNRYVAKKITDNLWTRIQELIDAGNEPLQISLHVSSLAELEQHAREVTPPERHWTRGRTSESVVEQAQLNLFQLERSGQFTTVSINPQNEFPTLLTRIPIFVPGRAGKQREHLDKDNALPFQTSWGTGRKFGPPLTVYDEDTLMALGRLRQNMLIGDPSLMPYPVSKLYASAARPDVHVHVVFCMLSDIQAVCDTSVGGRNNKLRLESVRRLAATKIEFNKETQDKVQFSGTTIDLVQVKWDAYEDNAILYIQFSPIMAQWLERAYTYIDWNLRRKLRTDVGKAVHRFLSGQPKTYQIYTRKLQSTIGHTGPYKHFMADLREALGQLQDAQWIHEFQISGNGRKQPHKLILQRATPNPD